MVNWKVILSLFLENVIGVLRGFLILVIWI